MARRVVNDHRRLTALGLLAAVPLAFLVVFVALPVWGMVSRGLVTAGGLDLGAIPEVLARPRTQRAVGLTLGLASAGTAVTLALGLPTAYVLHRLRFRGAGVLRAVVVMPFVLPTVVVGVMFRALLAPGGPLGWLGLDGSWGAVLMAFVFFNLAVVVRTVGSVWEGLDPRMTQAAASLGATPWRAFRDVTLPALAPAILSAGMVVFLYCATSFGVVLTLGGTRHRTVESEIYLLTTAIGDLRAAAVLSLLQIAAVLTMVVLVGRARARVERTGRRVGVARGRHTVSVRDVPAVVVAAAVVGFVVTPLVTLVMRSLGSSGEVWRNYRLALWPDGEHRALLVPLGEAAEFSLRTAVDATLLALVLGVCVSLVVAQRPRTGRGRRVLAGLDAAFMLPLGISAVTVGFGFLITLNRPPLDLRTSSVLVPIAQAMVALPLVVRTLTPALRAIDPRLRQAAASMGAGPWRVLWDVDLPLVWRPLLAAGGFAFATSLGEFGATSFLAQRDRPTVPVLIYHLISRPGADNLGMALAASVVLALLIGAVMGVVERLRVGSVGTF